MGSRLIRFCDWCEAEGNSEHGIHLYNQGWRETSTGLLCPPCVIARRVALERAKADRMAACGKKFMIPMDNVVEVLSETIGKAPQDHGGDHECG